MIFPLTTNALIFPKFLSPASIVKGNVIKLVQFTFNLLIMSMLEPQYLHIDRSDNTPRPECKLAHTFHDICRTCPANYTCLPDAGPNPDYGYTNFDHMGWSLVMSFQLLTMDFWENIYNKVGPIKLPPNMINCVFLQCSYQCDCFNQHRHLNNHNHHRTIDIASVVAIAIQYSTNITYVLPLFAKLV